MAEEKVRYDNVLTLKLDDDTQEELQTIALFERETLATFGRGLLVEAVKRYRRNPQYKSWKKRWEASKKN